MSELIPQKVNIAHALQSTVVEKMKADIKEYQGLPELSVEQMEVVDNYINSLDSAFTQFCMDNEHVEKRRKGITNADIELFEGLKKMYLTYMDQLSEIKKERLAKDQEVGKDRPLEYMNEELPYLLPSDRFNFVKELLETPNLNLVKNDKLLKVVQNLALIDGTLKDNLRLYRDLLKKVGCNDNEVRNVLPHFSKDNDIILPPETNLVQTDLTQEFDSSNTTNSANDISNEEKKKISFLKYLKKDTKDMNENGKRTLPPDSVESCEALKKYKSDGKSEVSVQENTGGIDTNTSTITNNNNNNNQNNNNNDDDNDSNNNGLISILKNENRKKSKTSSGIKFVDDSKLVTIFGEGLPNEGITASPRQLKKILKPFRDGEPAEFVLEGWKERGAKPLVISITGVTDSDISELKNGPAKLVTNVPSALVKNFTSFSPDLNKPALEPVHTDDNADDSGKGLRKQKAPIIARAFGKNSLLLRKDRGGLPYKRVPEVNPNKYPVRPDLSENEDAYEVGE